MLPIYIVTGYLRSGTSMMMQCLIKGGLTPVFDKKREIMNARHGDKYYKPNLHGFYEPSMQDFQDLRFPTQFPGMLIKILRPGIAIMRPYDGGYHIVCMQRNKEEIRQSYEGFFGYPIKDHYFSEYDNFINWISCHAMNRKDVISYNILQYRDVVENPVSSFAKLKDSGWPIDIDEASFGVDPTQYRFRLERLTMGIS